MLPTEHCTGIAEVVGSNPAQSLKICSGLCSSNVTAALALMTVIKCFVIYLDFHIAKTNKQRLREGNNCAIVSRSGYIEFDQRHVTKNQPITVIILLSESVAL